MNILIAPDKFKGSLTALEVCEAIAQGLRVNYPEADIRFAPLADGGDGTLTILRQILQLRLRPLKSCDPLGRPIEVAYLENDESAFIEVASASGLVLLRAEERDPLRTSTFGTGLQLRDALARGKKHISLLLGGSATNDLGMGIAEAIGFTFYDTSGSQIRPSGGQLSAIQRIEYPEERPWKNMEITLLCDVDNPLYGPHGAAHVYAAQKGADHTAIGQLERGAKHTAGVIAKLTGKTIDNLPGGGAAGGIGAGLTALIGAQVTSGFDTVKRLVGLEEKVKWADLVICGEGQVDSQSLQGKVVGGVLDLCQLYGKKCQLFVGRSMLKEVPFVGTEPVRIHEVINLAPDVETAMREADGFLTELAKTLTIH